MMIKNLTLFTLMAGLFVSVNSYADFYGQVGWGYSFNGGHLFKEGEKHDYKDSGALSVAAGYELPLLFFSPRIEGEYIRLHPKVKNSNVSSLNGFFLNGYCDLPLLPIIDTYVGAGIGKTRFEGENSSAVQGMIGLEYEIPFVSTTIGGEYRYLKVNEDSKKEDSKARYHANVLMLKVRYSF